jgi:NADPH:quinone reductase-like Zn-dependent oxidoreductase
VQIAKADGADVTGVCSGRNVELVRSIGADRVIDYTREDFAADGEPHYDLILDMAGTRSFADRKRALRPGGTAVLVGGPVEGLWIGPVTGEVKRMLASMGGDRKLTSMLTRFRLTDLETLAGLLEAGTIVPVIDRTYPLSEVRDAIAYAMKGHARGKVVITV